MLLQRRVFKWIMQSNLLIFALIKLLVFAPLFNLPPQRKVVICTAHGWSCDVVSLICTFNPEFSPPIGAFMELRFNANLPCLVSGPKYSNIWSLNT